MNDANISLAVFGCLLIMLLILRSPKWLNKAYIIWFLFLIITIQITYNELSLPKDLTTKIFTGKDSQNLQAIFKVYMLNDKFSWKLKSDNTVQINGEDTNISFLFNSLDIDKEIDRALAVICLGNSSHEGNPIEEENRATRRANQIAKWLQEFYPENSDKIHTLDLGVNTVLHSETATQRRLIIISILNTDSNVNIIQALQNGLSEQGVLPFNIKEYSKFELK